MGSVQAVVDNVASSPCCEVTNVSHPAQPDDWDAVESLNCLQFEKCETWMKMLNPFHHILALGVAVLRLREEHGLTNWGDMLIIASKLDMWMNHRGLQSVSRVLIRCLKVCSTGWRCWVTIRSLNVREKFPHEEKTNIVFVNRRCPIVKVFECFR